MIDFESNVDAEYAKEIIDRKLPDEPYGVVGNQGNIPVDPEEVLLGEDGGIPDALSLPRNSYVEVNFGNRTLVDREGADSRNSYS